MSFKFGRNGGGAGDDEKPGPCVDSNGGDGGAGGAGGDGGIGGGGDCGPLDVGRVGSTGEVRFPDGNDIDRLLVHGTDSCRTSHLPLKMS